jgi:3-deoxy-D-manno-octulosonic-acid transferase
MQIKTFFMILGYKALVNLLFLMILPFLPLVWIFSEKRRANLCPRLGFKTGFRPGSVSGKKRIWIHALSLGEVKSALPFVQALKNKHRTLDIVFTVSTRTGFDLAGQLFLKGNPLLVDQLGYFPLDLGFCVKKISRQIGADAVVLVETDLWPNFLYEMKKQKVPVILINARLSKKSFNRYLFARKFFVMFFSRLTGIMAQTLLDKERFRRLGVDENRVWVTGNIKFDQESIPMDGAKCALLRSRFGIGDGDRVWIAGSTHRGEEEIVLDVFASMKPKIPGLKLILAPRDPGRSRQVIKNILLSDKWNPVLLSQSGPDNSHHDVIIIDGLGLLATAYAVCDAAFIGGSLVPRGGHNPLEPAMFGRPILFGPYMTDFVEVSHLLIQQKGAFQVDTARQLADKLAAILTDPELGDQMGRAGLRVFSRNAGAVDRIISRMEDLNLV